MKKKNWLYLMHKEDDLCLSEKAFVRNQLSFLKSSVKIFY